MGRCRASSTPEGRAEGCLASASAGRAGAKEADAEIQGERIRASSSGSLAAAASKASRSTASRSSRPSPRASGIAVLAATA
jgi:hypothetical protein